MQASSNKTIVINGRVVGPKVTATTDSRNNSKAPGATRQPHVANKFVKAPSKFTKTKAPSSSSSSGSSLALQDKLDLPLDALVHNKSPGFHKRMRK